MSIKFRVVEKGNPGDQTAPKKFYGVVKSVGKTTLFKLAKKIAQSSTVSMTDVYAVIMAFLEMIPTELEEGKTVTLGEFGSFKTTIRTEGADTKEEFNSRNITKSKIVFTAGKEFKSRMRDFTYEDIDELILVKNKK
ncbi:MAG: HU family DNA-binding protein [Candidatus Cloacimonetes bacterium]|nr:HU family DNA-binding protein [Candidatus Cloacimonadota bacterium]